MSRRIIVSRDWSARGKAETVSWKVVLAGERGGHHYVLLSTPRLAADHRLQPALECAARAAAKALQPMVEDLPS